MPDNNWCNKTLFVCVVVQALLIQPHSLKWLVLYLVDVMIKASFDYLVISIYLLTVRCFPYLITSAIIVQKRKKSIDYLHNVPFLVSNTNYKAKEFNW